MGRRIRSPRAPQTPSAELERTYARALAGTNVHDRHVEVAGRRVHLLEKGEGPPLVLLHGTGNAAGFLLPLLDRVKGVRVIAPDLPGIGLSEAFNTSPKGLRARAIEWLDGLLDVLEVDATALLGHSGGGVWSSWYALGQPSRVTRLVLIGMPTLPGSRCPVPLRLTGTPGVGWLLGRLMKPTHASMLQLAELMGERETLAARPDLLDLMVATARDPGTARAARREFRTLVSPVALLTPSGFRARSRIGREQLRRLAMPALVIWGDRDPLAGPADARAAAQLMPNGGLEVVAAGHAPWLGHPERIASLVQGFVLDQHVA